MRSPLAALAGSHAPRVKCDNGVGELGRLRRDRRQSPHYRNAMAKRTAPHPIAPIFQGKPSRPGGFCFANRQDAIFDIALMLDRPLAGNMLRTVMSSIVRREEGSTRPSLTQLCATRRRVFAILRKACNITSSHPGRIGFSHSKRIQLDLRPGISARTGSRFAFSSASSPSRSGRPRCGSRARASRQRAARLPRRARPHPIPRLADHNAQRDQIALRRPTRRPPGRAS